MIRNDLTIYSRFANEWWQPSAPRFRSLQAITPFRLELINEMLGDQRGKRILDIGCGGGLLSKPLVKQGANVSGIDISAGSVAVARQAAGGDGEFVVGDATNLPFEDNIFDNVLLADVLDHIPNYARALTEAARVLKRNGMCFVGTLNRTFLGKFLTVTIGEGLRLIPPGTHDPRLFIRPAELESHAAAAGLNLVKLQGEKPQFFRTIRTWAIHLERSNSTQIAYSASFVKAT